MAIGVWGGPCSRFGRGKHRKLSCPFPFDKSSKHCCVPFGIDRLCSKLGFRLIGQSPQFDTVDTFDSIHLLLTIFEFSIRVEIDMFHSHHGMMRIEESSQVQFSVDGSNS